MLSFSRLSSHTYHVFGPDRIIARAATSGALEEARMDEVIRGQACSGPGQLAALEAALEKLRPAFSAPSAGGSPAEGGGGGAGCDLTTDEKDALSTFLRQLQEHRREGRSFPEALRPSQTESDESGVGAMTAAPQPNAPPPGGPRQSASSPGARSAAQTSPAASMTDGVVQSAGSAREAGASAAGSMEDTVALMREGEEREGGASANGTHRGGGGVKGGVGEKGREEGEKGASATGTGLVLEGGEREVEGVVGERKREAEEEATTVEAAERAGEEADGIKGLRRAVIRIQRQNALTHGILAFIVVSSMAWRFGTIALVHSVHRTVTRPFDAMGNRFGGFFRRNNKLNKGKVTMEGPNQALEALGLPSFGQESDPHSRAIEGSEEVEVRQESDKGSILDFFSVDHDVQ